MKCLICIYTIGESKALWAGGAKSPSPEIYELAIH